MKAQGKATQRKKAEEAMAYAQRMIDIKKSVVCAVAHSVVYDSFDWGRLKEAVDELTEAERALAVVQETGKGPTK